MNSKHILTLAGGLMLALVTARAAKQPAAPAPATAAAPLPASKTFTGKVVETMNASSYTYVLVDTGKEKLWAAGPQAPMKVGDSVTVTGGIPMENYHSKTLKRDFDVVYLTANLQGSGAEAAPGNTGTQLPAGHPPIGGGAGAQLPAGHPAIGGAIAAPKVDLTGLKKAKDGQTIQEIFAGKSALQGKPVTVRGKVVKYNSGIMNKNWLHIQDGTGAVGNNDLTVTTSATAKVGDTVLVSGKVTTDKDFGAGYRFAVILEDAKVVVE